MNNHRQANKNRANEELYEQVCAFPNIYSGQMVINIAKNCNAYNLVVSGLDGEMAERLNALVLKTSKGLRPSRVRIPVSPPYSSTYSKYMFSEQCY